MAAEHINTILERTLVDLDNRHMQQAQEWPLVKRNKAITSRNRNWKKICEMLEIEFKEMPLERPEVEP